MIRTTKLLFACALVAAAAAKEPEVLKLTGDVEGGYVMALTAPVSA